MTAYTDRLYTPWSLQAGAGDERRFRRILRVTLLSFLVPCLVIPGLPLPKLEHHAEPLLPKRLATLVLEQKPAAKAPQTQPQVVEPVPQPEKAVRPVPRKSPPQQARPKRRTQQASARPAPVNRTASARRQAEQSGLLALKDSLRDLRQYTVPTSLKQAQALTQAGGQVHRTERAILTSDTTSGSAGINTARLSRNTGGSTLASRATTQFGDPAGGASRGGGGGGTGAGRAGGAGNNSPGAGRSIEEIQMVFDQNKGAIYSLYNRALRDDPTLQGKIVLRLSIAPSGMVTMCELVSSELHDAALGEKIARRVKLFNFGARNVEAITITYPIVFLPA
jgi:hypothetical protein